MRIRRLLFFSCLAAQVVATGCEGEAPDESLDNRVEIPEPPDPELGVQLVMPEFTVPAGSEMMWCWVADWLPSRDLLVHSFDSFQSEVGGHHLVALGSTVPFSQGHEFDCTNLDSMTALEPLVLPEAGNQSNLPEGFGVRLPEGANVVIQSHYINYTDQEMRVRDVVHLGWFDEGAEVTEASYLILNHGALDIPPGESSASVACALPGDERDYGVISLFGHMHEYGAGIVIGSDRGEGAEELYRIDDWRVSYRDFPPITEWAPTEPLEMRSGDEFSVTCSYDNTGESNLRFPEEMCSAVALYFPATDQGIVVCDDPVR